MLWGVPLFLLVSSPFWRPGLVDFLTPRYGFSPVSEDDRAAGGYSMSGVTMTRSVDGRPEAILSADTVKSGRWDGDDYYMEEIDALLFDEGEIKAHVISGEGYYDVNEKILTLVDNVSVMVGDTYELRTEALRYLLPYKTLKTGMDIFFKSQDIIIEGTGMRYNFETGDYRVGGRVKFDKR
jgi:LPS export ABC transporter protein LptC